VVRVWVAMMLGLVVALGARGVSPRPEVGVPGAQAAAEDPHPSPLPEGEGAGAERDGVRFEVVDIFVDSGLVPLAAYQVEVRATAGDVKLVGVEGGAHAAFAAAPFYDPAALHAGRMRERIVIAAFSTAGELPTGRTRVARLHVRVSGAAAYSVKLETAGGVDGHKIDARASYAPADGGAGDR